jgi:hypothetical protein
MRGGGEEEHQSQCVGHSGCPIGQGWQQQAEHSQDEQRRNKNYEGCHMRPSTLQSKSGSYGMSVGPR